MDDRILLLTSKDCPHMQVYQSSVHLDDYSKYCTLNKNTCYLSSGVHCPTKDDIDKTNSANTYESHTKTCHGCSGKGWIDSRYAGLAVCPICSGLGETLTLDAITQLYGGGKSVV